MSGADYSDLEAVQFRPLAPWHIVRPNWSDGTPSNVTLCGRGVLRAERMWAEFDAFGHGDQCVKCSQVLPRLVRLTRCPVCGQTSGMSWVSRFVPDHHALDDGQELRRCPGSGATFPAGAVQPNG